MVLLDFTQKRGIKTVIGMIFNKKPFFIELKYTFFLFITIIDGIKKELVARVVR